MLSIVKMDLDSGMDLLEEQLIKSEEIDIVEEPIGVGNHLSALNNAVDKLQLIPIVYTTRLDDMSVLQSYPIQIDQRDVSARILKQSRPMLRVFPVKKRRRNKKKFEEIKARIQTIYSSPKKSIAVKIEEGIEEIITPDVQSDPDTVKIKVLGEPSSENTKPEEACKYSDLLKLCKPCSVVLPVMAKHPVKHVIHGGQVLQANSVQNSILATLLKDPSSDEEQPLITLCPELLVIRNTTDKVSPKPKDGKNNYAKLEKKTYRHPKSVPVSNVSASGQKPTDLASHIAPRLMRNGVLELHDTFSNEFYIYYTDNESNLLSYFRDTIDKAHLYTLAYLFIHSRYSVNNCCWVAKDQVLQSLYPKVLLYQNSRFMRSQHPCKPGDCVCCCRKKENTAKPNLVITKHPTASANQKTLEKEDMEIQDLEDEIHKSIININKTPKLNSSEWLRKLLTPSNPSSQNPNSLIEKALTYKKPQLTKPKDNRRLVTLKKGDSQNSVIILKNFAMDVTEIYEIDADGNIETYIKTNCYNNTCQPDVKQLLKKQNAIIEAACCWFKRKEVITKLRVAKILHPAAEKFIRTSHTCTIQECTCCCKPKTKKQLTLNNIKLPSRTDWSTTLNSFISSQDFQPQPLSSFSMATESSPAKLQLGPPPLVAMSSQTASSQNDDCKITSVMTSPSLRPIPQNLTVPTLTTVPIVPVVAPPTTIIVTDAVDTDEMSQEVNSLISSILDRFKNVRLTINSDGKVAAALDTPVNTLSTVELKVLANILSFAQSQINSIGSNVDEGMSLSNIINLKVDDVNNSKLDPHTVFKTFGKNQNLSQKQPPQTQPIYVNIAPLPFPQVPQNPTAQQTYSCFSNATSIRNQHFNDSFSSFITTKMNPEPSAEAFTPVIENVFSLKEEPEGTESSSTTVWYRKPAGQPIVSTLSENTVTTYTNTNQKRKEIELPMANPKKIRVLSPSKLGVATGSSLESTTTAHNPAQQTVSIGGFLPGVPLLSNSNFQISNAHTPRGNFMSPTTASQPILIINPLNTPNLINTGDTVSVPFTDDSLQVQNVVSISHPQSNIPCHINPISETQLANAESKNVPVAQAIPPVATAPEPEETPDTQAEYGEDDAKAENCEDDAVVENCVDDAEAENCEDDAEAENCEDTDANVEDCDDNNSEEEVCILGF